MQSSQLQHFSSKQNTAKLNPFNAGSHKREGSRRAEEGKVPEDIYKVKKISEHTSPCGSVCSAAGKSSGGFVWFCFGFFCSVNISSCEGRSPDLRGPKNTTSSGFTRSPDCQTFSWFVFHTLRAPSQRSTKDFPPSRWSPWP